MPERCNRSRGFLWAVSVAVLGVVLYLVSTGPVCRWSWRTARQIYMPLNRLANSKAGEPLLRRWLSLWGAVPWWNQPAPLLRSAGTGSEFSTVFMVSRGKLVPVVNGVPENVDFEQLRRAAESGNARAQLRLGTCLYDGRHGVPASPAEAYKWTLLAVTNGVRDAGYLAGEMEIFLTAEQLKQGRSAAAAFVSSKAAPSD